VIVVAGEALVDLVEEADGRLRPVAGGGPLNTAIALGRLDVPAAFLGTLSRDDYGRLLSELLADAGINMSLVRWSDAPTPLAVVHRHPDGQNGYTFYLASTSLTDLPPRSLPELPREARAIHVGTLALAVDPPASTLEALVDREAGKRRIILDPNVRPAIFGDANAYRARLERIARLADVVKLSEDDADWIYPELDRDAVLDYLLTLGPRLIAITSGERGACAASEAARVAVPATPIAVVDTVGAGDTFGAALIAALSARGAFDEGRPALGEDALSEILAFAVEAATITCTRVGAVPPTRDELAALKFPR
jgi:fructokinase